MWCKLSINISPFGNTAIKAVTAGLRCWCLDKNGDTDDDRKTQDWGFYHHTQATCRIRSTRGDAPSGRRDADHPHGRGSQRTNRGESPCKGTRSEHSPQWISDQEIRNSARK